MARPQVADEIWLADVQQRAKLAMRTLLGRIDVWRHSSTAPSTPLTYNGFEI